MAARMHGGPGDSVLDVDLRECFCQLLMLRLNAWCSGGGSMLHESTSLWTENGMPRNRDLLTSEPLGQ